MRNKYAKELTNIGAEILIDQRGDVLRNKDKRAIEPFDYVDGVSQPDFFGQSKGSKYNQNAALELILTRDRHSSEGFGSYFVYRLLEQNVDSFNAAVENVATQLKVTPDLAGAMAVGRFKK